MPSRAEQIVTPSTTSVLLGAIVVVDLLADTFAFAQIAGQVLLLLLVVMAEQFLPVVWVHALLLLNNLTLHLLLLRQHQEVRGRRTRGRWLFGDTMDKQMDSLISSIYCIWLTCGVCRIIHSLLITFCITTFGLF